MVRDKAERVVPSDNARIDDAPPRTERTSERDAPGLESSSVIARDEASVVDRRPSPAFDAQPMTRFAPACSSVALPRELVFFGKLAGLAGLGWAFCHGHPYYVRNDLKRNGYFYSGDTI